MFKTSKYSICLIALLSCLTISGCDRRDGPAPVAQLGLNTTSVADSVLIREDDTIWTIAKQFRLPLQDIVAHNNLTPPYALETGQRLYLPQPAQYTVKERDTLYSISKMFRVDVNQLVRLNNLPSPYRLHTQQQLRLPSRGYHTASAGHEVYAATPAYPVYDRQPQYLPTPHDTIVQEDLAPPTQTSSYTRPQTTQWAPQHPQYSQPQDLRYKETQIRPSRKPAGQRFTANHTTSSNSKNSSGFVWPVRGEILSDFGPKSGGLHNDGINISVPGGTPVKAASNGTVIYVGDDLDSFGNLVLIRHNNGWVSAYAHLQNVKTARGAVIKQGQVLGTVGSTGNVKSPQLHFELRKGSTALNPKQHLL